MSWQSFKKYESWYSPARRVLANSHSDTLSKSIPKEECRMDEEALLLRPKSQTCGWDQFNFCLDIVLMWMNVILYVMLRFWLTSNLSRSRRFILKSIRAPDGPPLFHLAKWSIEGHCLEASFRLSPTTASWVDHTQLLACNYTLSIHLKA